MVAAAAIIGAFFSGKSWLLYTVLGIVCGGAIAASVVIIIIGFYKAGKDRRRESEDESFDPHAQFVYDEENKRGLEREVGVASFETNQWLNAFETQTVCSVICGVIFLAALLFAPLVCAYLFEKWWKLGAVGILAGFGGIILIAAIMTGLYNKINLCLAKNDKNAVETVGTVVASSKFSMHRLGVDMSAPRYVGVTYRVKFKIGERTVIGYSRNRYYRRGEDIVVKFNPKRPWRCYIIG